MKIINVNAGSRKFRIKDCKGMSSVKGLMFDSLKTHDGALIYANNIWMPFIKKDLNLVFLDKEMKVIEQRLAVPMSFYPSSWKIYKNKRAKYCLELKNTKIKFVKGSRIKISGI